MTKIELTAWARNLEDFSGRSQCEVYFVMVNGREVPMGRQDVFKHVKLHLEDRTEPDTFNGGVTRES